VFILTSGMKWGWRHGSDDGMWENVIFCLSRISPLISHLNNC
jgi:hypothetical protein